MKFQWHAHRFQMQLLPYLTAKFKVYLMVSDLIVYYNAKNYKCARNYKDTFFIVQLDAFEMMHDRFDRVII